MASEDAVTNFFYCAVHTVTVAGKQFVQNWYTGALARSYFFGCSDGGREGIVEATRYPADFDGYIVGEPFFDTPGQMLATKYTNDDRTQPVLRTMPLCSFPTQAHYSDGLMG